jgi:hypothetical protein
MKKIILLLLFIPYLNYSQSKDILKVYSGDKDIEIVDGFIFKIIVEVENKHDTAYLILVKEKYSSENYFVVGMEWSNKLNSYKGNIQNKIHPYGVQINMFGPNEYKNKYQGIEYTMSFSKNKWIAVDEFGKKAKEVTGQLKSINDITFMSSEYAFSMGSDDFDRD